MTAAEMGALFGTTLAVGVPGVVGGFRLLSKAGILNGNGNGTVRREELPCGEHKTELALLRQAQETFNSRMEGLHSSMQAVATTCAETAKEVAEIKGIVSAREGK
jgi:hypothetical protein